MIHCSYSGLLHVCSKPAFLPAPPDLDRGSSFLAHKAKLMCSFFASEGTSCSPRFVEPGAACTCCLASTHPCLFPLWGLYAVLLYFLIAWHLLACSWLAGVKFLVSCHFWFYSLPSFLNKTTTYFSFQLTLLWQLSFVVWDACLLTIKERMIPAVFHFPRGKLAKPAGKR